MEALKNIEEMKLLILLEAIDNPVTTISAKESRYTIDIVYRKRSTATKVAAKYSLIFAETQSANGSWHSEHSYLDILLLEKRLRNRIYN